MSVKSKIEWCTSTWNPTTGCTKVSAGCQNCYAERMAKRFWAHPFSEVRCHERMLEIPLRWKKPQRIFVDSMSDLFHPDVPFKFINLVFVTMFLSSKHIFIILTKRPERMLEWFNYYSNGGFSTAEIVRGRANLFLNRKPDTYFEQWKWPLHNVWIGVSAENQTAADKRIPDLMRTPAAVRFVSVEPMLGPVDLTPWLNESPEDCNRMGVDPSDVIDWVIAGCEKPNKRQTDIAWVRDLRDQCIDAGTRFFLKQMVINGRIIKMPELDGRVWDQYPGAKEE
jgi:protein gp37